ncbi:HNH endonuclease, partial [Streptococcus pneumoniae]|nr:HNH endonuclease [Streptococcus pneumoniae]
GTHSGADIKALAAYQKYKCPVCMVSIKNSYHIDHIVPLSSGGSNGKENLQLLCPPCNLSKSTKHSIEFMQSRGFLL